MSGRYDVVPYYSQGQILLLYKKSKHQRIGSYKHLNLQHEDHTKPQMTAQLNENAQIR